MRIAYFVTCAKGKQRSIDRARRSSRGAQLPDWAQGYAEVRPVYLAGPESSLLRTE
jgi:hypothetical protein